MQVTRPAARRANTGGRSPEVLQVTRPAAWSCPGERTPRHAGGDKRTRPVTRPQAIERGAPSAPRRAGGLPAPLTALRGATRVVVAGLFAAPVAVAVPLALREAAAAAAWSAWYADPQVWAALRLSVSSAVVGTWVALMLAMVLVAALHERVAWHRLARRLPTLLALPHAAFAIGVAWLVAPSGAIARLLAPVMGWVTPPGWVTVQDPHAVLLTAVLVLKELPFLLWNLAAGLARPDVELQLRAQRALARSLGYTGWSLWWRVLWPLWLPRLAWPLLAVLAYGLTVVDLGLIVGPGSPPTLAVLAYTDLTSASVADQQRGAVGAVVLAGVLAALVLAAWSLWPPVQRAWLRVGCNGRRPVRAPRTAWMARATAAALPALYAVVLGVLALLSLAGVWTFPAAWPGTWTTAAWQQVMASASTVGFSVTLAVAAACVATTLTLAWLEATPPAWDSQVTPLVLAPLVVPPLLLMSGLYQAALGLRLDGSIAGLLWVHVLVTVPYAYITLQPAWRAFDPRYAVTALLLGRSRWTFWWRIKRQMLAAPLASALGVGFAVSIAQYLATQFIGAGRHPTITTEAVTLASGGQRALAAAFALLQALLPLAGFAWAQAVGRRGGLGATDARSAAR